ncbi:hypothetical protein, partial [Niveispirillum sp.]|uniref:beta strand repeat-containing protein n=1 Tax=Niveispirillum sp. TaxID=1917217 RepID=UPI001B6DDF4F
MYIASTGTLGALSNTGIIQGNITNNSVRDLTIVGTGGTLTGQSGMGTILNTLSNVVLSSGSQFLNHAVNVAGHTLVNDGTALTLNSIVNVTGNYAQTGGSLALGANSGLVVSGAASITGATITANLSATGNYLTPGGATLVGAGAASSYASIVATSNSITGLVSSGSTVVGNSLLLSFANNYVGGTLATLTNTGTVSAATAVYIAATGNLGTLVNSGLLAGDIKNLSAQDLTIAGAGGTLTGQSGMGTILNTLSNVVLASGSQLLNNAVNVDTGTVTNAGAAVSLNTVVNITGNYSQTAGSLILGAEGQLVVSGAASITGGTIAASLAATGNYVPGVQTTLLSAGSASAVSAVVTASGITGLQTGSTLVGNNLLLTYNNAYVGGTLATMTNSGTISAATAVYIAATGNLGTLVNSGLLAGDIKNLSAQDLTITGTGGTLTGQSGMGTITNTLSNVVLASGSQLLNNAVNVAGHTLVNNDVALSLNTLVNVTGDYAQTGGSLILGADSGLVVSGAASITGASVTASLSTAGNYLISGGATLVAAGAASSYASIVATSNSITGLVSSGSTVVGNNLLLSFANNYVGGTLATLTNTGTVSAATAVYIAATGNLGTVVNSGLLAGDIKNLSAQDLTITGGTSGTIGTLTGQSGMGTILNTLSNVVFASGNLLLNDRVIATGHTVSNI